MPGWRSHGRQLAFDLASRGFLSDTALDVLFQVGDHGIEASRKLGDFVVAVNVGDAHIEVSRAHCSGSNGQSLDGAGDRDRCKHDGQQNNDQGGNRNRKPTHNTQIDGRHDLGFGNDHP